MELRSGGYHHAETWAGSEFDFDNDVEIEDQHDPYISKSSFVNRKNATEAYA